MGTYAPKVGYATSTGAGHENLMAFQEVVKSNGLSVAMLDFCQNGALAMFPKTIHNPSFANMTQEEAIKELGLLGLYIMRVKGGDRKTVDTLQGIKKDLGFETSRIGISGVHVPKTQAEERLVLYALKKNPSIEQLAQYILRVPFSDLK